MGGEGPVFAIFLLAARAMIAVVGICVTEKGGSGRKAAIVLGAGGGVRGGGGEGGHRGWSMRRGYCLLVELGGVIGDGGLRNNGIEKSFKAGSLEKWFSSGRPLERCSFCGFNVAFFL